LEFGEKKAKECVFTEQITTSLYYLKVTVDYSLTVSRLQDLKNLLMKDISSKK
jgi:hypothetical protein